MRNLIYKLKNMSKDDQVVLKHIIGAFLIRGIGLLLSLFTMPAYLRFFNNEMALGLWFTILSLLNWILTFDLGIGNGLRNKLTESLTKKDFISSKKYVSSAYIAITCLGLLIGCILSCIFNYFNWNVILNIEENIVSPESLLVAIQITFWGIIIQLILRLITSILYALQLSSINNFLSLCTSFLTFILVLACPSKSNDENIIIMAIIHAIAVVIPLIVATIIVFFQQRKNNFSPNLKMFSFHHAKEVLSLGGIFLYVQIMYMIIMNTNSYLITLFSTPEDVVEYEIYYKIFSLVSTMFTLMLTPIWSSITKAMVSKNMKWIRSLYKKLIVLSFACVGCEFLMIPILQTLINIWLDGNTISVNYWYGSVFAVMGSLMIFNGTFSSIANGLGKLKSQAACFSIGAILKIVLSYIITSNLESWIGVIIATAISLLLYCMVQPIILKKQLVEVNEINIEETEGTDAIQQNDAKNIEVSDL